MAYCKKCGAELPKGAQYCPKCGTAVAEIMPTLKTAYWGERFVAWLIDVAILGVIIWFLNLLTFSALPNFNLFPSLFWIPFVNLGFSNIIYFVYWTLMDGIYGQSFGKMVMRLRVTRLDGRRVDLAYAALESVGKAFLLPLDCILGWALYPKRRQRIFNYISETIVVKT
jgi:uncharacterized RDD family membrane protein YckC